MTAVAYCQQLLADRFAQNWKEQKLFKFHIFIFGFFGGNWMKIFWLSLRWTCFHGKETEGGGALELHTCHPTVY